MVALLAIAVGAVVALAICAGIGIAIFLAIKNSK